MSTIEALDDGRLRDRWTGWAVTIGITVLAFALRFVNLGFPKAVLFDETYYAKDAWTILQNGYERNWPDPQADRDKEVLAGNFLGVSDNPQYVVHPPLGKLIIGWGEQLFGFNPFGWRFFACVFGALLIFFTIRLARRLSRSTLIGAIAGILLTFDGLAFVMSRIALLDIFQATFAVAAISALVADRDWFRHKLADHLRKNDLVDLDGQYGPLLLFRPWRFAAGVLLGASCAVKWNSVYLIAAFGIFCVVWDLLARRAAGAGRRTWWSILGDGVAAFVQIVVVAIPVYIATWARWLTTSGGYNRNWGAENPDEPVVKLLGTALGSLWKYHTMIYHSHTVDLANNVEHPYKSHPLTWLFMVRPVAIYAPGDVQPGVEGCTADSGTTCLRIIVALGTPVLWWMAAIALIAGLWWWIAKRDWRFAVPIVAACATWLTWLQYTGRALFSFYGIMMIPFTSIILAMALGKLLGRADAPDRRARAIAVGVAIALVILNFAYLYPVYTGALIERPAWLARMWFGTWI